MTEFWSSKRVLVTGGGGFLGRFVLERLRSAGCGTISVPRSREHDLRRREVIDSLLEAVRPDIVIHLAAVVGGIGANRLHPGKFFYDNLIMGTQLIESARVHGVNKFVCLGTICAYPKFAPVPFSEVDLWNGYPEETNAPYGIAKKVLLVQLQAYRSEYGSKGIYLLPVNLYGPHDNFDLQTSHVIPALIRKFVEAQERGDPEVVAWGSGTVSREFLFVEDAAEAIVAASESYDDSEPVNIGSGKEITIRDLATLIAELCGFTGAIRWDSSQPDGQPRRCLDTSRALKGFGFSARTNLRDGLIRTIDWYRALRSTAESSGICVS